MQRKKKCRSLALCMAQKGVSHLLLRPKMLQGDLLQLALHRAGLRVTVLCIQRCSCLGRVPLTLLTPHCSWFKERWHRVPPNASAHMPLP